MPPPSPVERPEEEPAPRPRRRLRPKPAQSVFPTPATPPEPPPTPRTRPTPRQGPPRLRPVPLEPRLPERRAKPEKIEYPPGHIATVRPGPRAVGFVGGAFSMDSLEFMRWAAVTYSSRKHVAIVLMYLIGCQAPGGTIEARQADIAGELEMSRSHLAGAYAVLEQDGVLRRIRRGVYQLNPAATLRGGVTKPAKGSPRGAKGQEVHQMDLLHDILEDENAPEAFRLMAQTHTLHSRPEGAENEGTI